MGRPDSALGETGPASFTDTDIRIANSDGTFTEILGNNFSQSADDTLTGTVTAVELFDSNWNNLLQTVNFTVATPASAISHPRSSPTIRAISSTA